MREPLGKHISIKHGYAFDGEFFVEEDNDVVLLTPGNFAIGGGFQEGKKYYNGPYPDEYVLSPGDLVVTMTDLSKTIDTLGYAALIPDDGRVYLHNQRIGLVEFKDDELDKVYLFYLLRTYHYQRTIAGSSTGSTVHHTSPAKIEAYPTEIPSVSIQKRIADILSAYDKLIENNRRQIALLEEAAQRLYKKWFVDLHFPGHETTPIHDGLPEGWRNGLLGDIVSFVSGYAFKSSSFSKEGNYKVVTIKNVLDGKFDGNGMDLIIDLPKNMTSECILHQGDILISLTGNVGRVCLVIGEKCLLNQRVAKIKTRAKAFTYCLFRLKATKAILENMSSGTAQKNLSTVKALQMSIMIPDEHLIRLFELNVKPLLDAIVNLESQIEYTREARDRLLPKLMSGEIEVG